MPIIYQHNINEATKLAVWEITEPETFFLQQVPLKKEVSHPHKRLQHLAGRYLLQVLYPGFPLDAIMVADTRKPFLESEQYHFSISHCGRHAAAIVSTTHRVGIDIEAITPRIEAMQHKFVGREEWDWMQKSLPLLSVALPQQKGLAPADFPSVLSAPLLTLLWSAKEALFKWYGSGQLDFKTHMQLSGLALAGGQGFITMPFLFRRAPETSLSLCARFFEQQVLSWLATAIL